MQKQKEERRRKQLESKQAAQRDRELKKQRLQVKLCNVCPHTCMFICTDIRTYIYSTHIFIHTYNMVHSVHTYIYIHTQYTYLYIQYLPGIMIFHICT